LLLRYSFTCSANSFPIRSFNAMSISSQDFPSSFKSRLRKMRKIERRGGEIRREEREKEGKRPYRGPIPQQCASQFSDL